MDTVGTPSTSPDQETDPADGSVLSQLTTLLQALKTSHHRRRLVFLAVGIVVVIGASMVGQVRLNTWQGAFYDAIEQQKVDAFISQLGVFLIIVACLLTLVVAETWLREMLEVRLREWLTHDLLDEWLAPKRAYLLAFAGKIGANPDQRLQADTQRLSEFSADLGIGLLRSTLLLISFVGVLWLLSDQILLVYGDQRFKIPGYLVWCALAYAISGSWLTWRVGRPLIDINAERYAREADLRFALVRINESAAGVVLEGGETDERRALDGPVDRVIAITRNLAGALARLTWITSGYGWLALVVPILIAAPGYFHGNLSFGELMMVVGAFNHVQQALRWFVDNFPRIADWRATLLRVVAFRDALSALETLEERVGRIKLIEDATGQVIFEDLCVELTDGHAELDQERVQIASGDHVLITGEPGSGKSALFRALADLCPLGSGTVSLPPRAKTMFLPQRPYLPLGTLRLAVSYPAAADRFDDTAIHAALERVGLAQYRPALDQDKRWDKTLSIDEQQRLAFARLLLHNPACVVLNDAVATIDENNRRSVLGIFERELASATVISINRSPASDDFYDRTLRLRRVPADASKRPGSEVRPSVSHPSAEGDGANLLEAVH